MAKHLISFVNFESMEAKAIKFVKIIRRKLKSGWHPINLCIRSIGLIWGKLPSMRRQACFAATCFAHSSPAGRSPAALPGSATGTALPVPLTD